MRAFKFLAFAFEARFVHLVISLWAAYINVGCDIKTNVNAYIYVHFYTYVVSLLLHTYYLVRTT
jgi:hypothetical protein